MSQLHASMIFLLFTFNCDFRVCPDEFREEFLLSFCVSSVDVCLSASKIDLVN